MLEILQLDFIKTFVLDIESADFRSQKSLFEVYTHNTLRLTCGHGSQLNLEPKFPFFGVYTLGHTDSQVHCPGHTDSLGHCPNI